MVCEKAGGTEPSRRLVRSDGELGRTGKEEDEDGERITVKRQAEPAVAEPGAAVGENVAAAP